MVAIGVLLIASMAAFSSQLASLNLMKTSRETDLAMADLQAAMEQVLAQTPSGLPTSDDYPHGGNVADFDSRNLDAEQIVVTYPGYVAGGDVPDPLPILLTISWNDFQGRPRQLQLSSMTVQ